MKVRIIRDRMEFFFTDAVTNKTYDGHVIADVPEETIAFWDAAWVMFDRCQEEMQHYVNKVNYPGEEASEGLS